jgi:DNA-directed RNA polymerase II subunit RPB2
LNHPSAISHLRRFSTPIDKTAKLIEPRKLHNTQWGYICPAETPEGHGVGVIKNMACTTHITIFSSPATILMYLMRQGTLKSLKETTTEEKFKDVRVFLNGSWIGLVACADALRTLDSLRKAKRAGEIHIHTGIVWKSALKELWLTTEAGRVIRPILYAPALREIAADKTGTLKAQLNALTRWNEILLWASPTGKHLIEYVDAGETEGTYIAMDYETAIKDTSRTHAEIHPCVALGTIASMSPPSLRSTVNALRDVRRCSHHATSLLNAREHQRTQVREHSRKQEYTPRDTTPRHFCHTREHQITP